MGDPRHALDRVLQRYAGKGWNILAATELGIHASSIPEADPTRHALRQTR